MLRHRPQPIHTRILVGRIRLTGTNVNTSRDRLMNNTLFLLLQQGNQFLFRVDMTLNLPLGVLEESNNGGLFGGGRNRAGKILKIRPIKILTKSRT